MPSKHYMVDVSRRIEEMRAMVDAGDHFCVNRRRQYGKMMTLATLKGTRAGAHGVVSLGCQKLSHADFRAEGAFARALAEELLDLADMGVLAIPDVAAQRFVVRVARGSGYRRSPTGCADAGCMDMGTR